MRRVVALGLSLWLVWVWADAPERPARV